MANKNLNTRIQLKNDTEANWNKATNFIPLEGETIIYSTDSTHPFSRLKVGDGTTTVNELPFVSSGTYVTMTMAQYEALTEAQKMDGTVRYITDADSYPDAGGVGF